MAIKKLEDIRLALTFDDVLLKPARSDILPKDVSIKSKLSSSITLNVPIISAAMDTVTEARLAIAMAQEGGLGIIHKNMSPEHQSKEVAKVKKYESGMILDPITVRPDQALSDALDIMREFKISGLPVTNEQREVLGILTNRDLRFETNFEKKISEVMTKDNLVTVSPGTGLEEAKSLLHKHRIEKLLVVDNNNKLSGLITIKDIDKSRLFPNACKDGLGRLRVGAAVGVGSDLDERLEKLSSAGVDIITLDSAHGHSKGIMEALKKVKSKYPQIDVIAGNIATAEAAKELISLGACSVKVGMGPGTICTTRIISGVGVPQVSAVMEVASAVEGSGATVIADGGIRYSGDIVKAIAAGADVVMIGSLFAGTTESPGETVLYQGRSYKLYRGMGSLGAMKKGSKDRYFQGEQDDQSKLVPEGIEGRVPFKGSLSSSVFQMVGGLRAGMGYCGVKDIEELKTKTSFLQVTSSGLGESHTHDVFITKEAPNYSR